MQIVGRPLRVRGGGEDQPAIAGQGLQPALDIGGMILARGKLQTQVGAEEGGAQFGDLS